MTSVLMEPRPVLSASKAPSRRVPKFAHRPALDGLRAVAALLVTLFHADVPFLRGGFVGVDVFFVLSGFLITSLLLREIVANKRLDFVAFYARRARRLLPPAVLVLVVTAVLFHFLASPLQVALDRGGFVAAATYVSNWYFLGQSQDYFAHDQDPSPVLHYWSLSVEEQFYFVWPAVLLAIMVYGAFRTRSLTKVVVGIALVSFVYAAVVNIDEPMLSYFGTFARVYQLLLGALVAIWVFRREFPIEGPAPRVDPRLAVLAPMGFAAILLASLTVFREEGPLQLGLIAAVGTAALLIGLELNSREGLARTLAHPRLRRLGDYSYSMYLWHWPVIVLLGVVGILPAFWPIRAVVVVALTVLLAHWTWRFVEQPFSRISMRRIQTRRILAAALPVGAVATAISVLFLLPVSARSEVLMQAADLNDVEAQHLTETTGSAAAGTGKVMLVGDSHAGFWTPTLMGAAEQDGWQFTVVRENGCPWPLVTSLSEGGRTLDCDAMLREASVATAANVEPDVVLLASHSILERSVQVKGVEVAPGSPAWVRAVDKGSREMVEELLQESRRVVVIAPIPQTEEPMVDCLSEATNPSECDAPVYELPSVAKLERIWEDLPRDYPRVTVVDIDDLVCPDDICPAMVDGVVTFRDDNHLTEDFAATLMDSLFARARINVT